MRAIQDLLRPSQLKQMLTVLFVAANITAAYVLVAVMFFPGSEPTVWEAVGTTLILTNVYLIVKQNNWNWPFGMVGVLVLGYSLYEYGLYSSAALNCVFFFGVQFWGWREWMYGGADRLGRRTTWCSWPERVALLLGAALFTYVWAGWVTVGLYDDPKHAYVDAAVMGMSIVSQIALSLKRIDSWLGWHSVNIMSIWLYSDIGAYMAAGLYAIFLFTATMGIHEWVRIRIHEGATPR